MKLSVGRPTLRPPPDTVVSYAAGWGYPALQLTIDTRP